MARAAAKRNRGAQQATRPVAAERARVRRKQEKSIEEQLFFSRIRGHAKWMFVLLALVFAASFVFLGVGSGQSGLGDVFQNIFSGSSGPSIKGLQEKVAENPRSQKAVTDLALALDRDGRRDEAVAAYQTYLELKPKDVDVLTSLASLYQARAGVALNDAFVARRNIDLAAPGAQFRPGSGVLGQAIGSQIDPLAQAASDRAEIEYQEAVNRYTAANGDALGVYQKLAKLDPSDPTIQFQYAEAAQNSQQFQVAIQAYQTFLKRFPEDQFASDARTRIKQLKKELANQRSSVDVSNPQASGG